LAPVITENSVSDHPEKSHYDVNGDFGSLYIVVSHSSTADGGRCVLRKEPSGEGAVTSGDATDYRSGPTHFLKHKPNLTKLNEKNLNIFNEEYPKFRKKFSSLINKLINYKLLLFLFFCFISLHHPAARQFCRSTYTIRDITTDN
jgi:hypothetical protein